MHLKIYWSARELTFSAETAWFTIVTIKQSNGTRTNSTTIWFQFNLGKLNPILCITHFLLITVMVLKKTPSDQCIHYNQSHPSLTWRKCSSKICTFWDLRPTSFQLNQMMRAGNSLSHSIVVTTQSKYTKFATRTLEESVASSWKERISLTHTPTDTTQRRTLLLVIRSM